MNKAPVLAVLCILALVLTACASGSASTSSSRNSSGGSRTLNPESKLALGTIKLEGTRQAVDPRVAAQLIPLWQLLLQLNSSSSSAPQEVTAVVDQIQTTITPAQLNTIDSMPLTQADIFTVFQDQAQANASGGTNGFGSSGGFGGNRGGGGGFIFVGGGGSGAFGGGFGGGGFRNNNGNGSGTTTQATASQSAQAAQARQNAISSLLINQLIKLLQTKLGS